MAAGYEELFYCQVDNPLVRIADPVFLGHHSLEGAQVSTKVVRRRAWTRRSGCTSSSTEDRLSSNTVTSMKRT
jgi:UDP-N-acetylglucosamine pyrophosphorylase